MGQPKVYNADQVLFVVANQRIDSGYADGEFLSHALKSDQMQSVVGSDGEVAVSKNNDQRVDINVTLMQTSDGNDVLSALYEQQKLGLIASVPYEIRDLNGRSLHEGRCWIRKPPDAAYDRTATSRQWQLEGDEDKTFYGGNRIG